MKYLSNYINEATTKCLKDTGAFFAFSDKQFNEQKNENTTGKDYIDMGAGLICPVDNAQRLNKELKEVIKDGIAQDIAENGKDAIIVRELANHEAYYTGDTESTIDALDGYKFTTEEINAVFKREQAQHIND